MPKFDGFVFLGGLIPQFTQAGRAVPSTWKGPTSFVKVHIGHTQSPEDFCLAGTSAGGNGVDRPEVRDDEAESVLYLIEILGLDLRNPA